MTRTGPPTVLFEVFWAHQKRKRLLEQALADVELPTEDYPFYVTIGVDGPLTPTALAEYLMLPLSTLATLEVGDFSVTAIEPLMVLLVCAWLARDIARRELHLVGGPFALPLALVLLAVLASSLVAQRLGLAYKAKSVITRPVGRV